MQSVAKHLYLSSNPNRFKIFTTTVKMLRYALHDGLY